MKKNKYVSFKSREEYPITNSCWWAQHLEGPFTPTEATSRFEELNTLEVDVKDILIFVQSK